MQVFDHSNPRERECRRTPERETEVVEQLVSHFRNVNDQAASILHQLLKITRDATQDDQPKSS